MVNRSYRIYDGPDIIEEGMHDVTWKEVRRDRDQELEDTDWRAMKDRVLPNEWKEFRDLLRTLPQRFEDPNDAADNWPQAPE